MPNQIVVKSHLFQGIAGPIRFNSRGNLALQQDHDLIQHELIMWLLTSLTETFMDLEDGVGLDTQLYDPSDSTNYTILSNYIRNRLNQLEHRIDVVDIQVRRVDEPGAESKIAAILLYQVPALIQAGADENYQVELIF